MTGRADLRRESQNRKGWGAPQAAQLLEKTYTVAPGKAYTVAEMNPGGV
jgi:hypothetical protein